MSKCCKCAKWFPHNWLCLKGLSVVFLVLFYMSVIGAIVMAWQVLRAVGQLPTQAIISGLVYYVGQWLLAGVGFLAAAKALKALGKIKQAVAPCCCEDKKEENAK